jgi:hypothetical protein
LPLFSFPDPLILGAPLRIEGDAGSVEGELVVVRDDGSVSGETGDPTPPSTDTVAFSSTSSTTGGGWSLLLIVMAGLLAAALLLTPAAAARKR